MGKDNKQPRVKGNLKPASSSRAADMLSSASTALPVSNLGGFAQFAGGAPGMDRTGSGESSDATGAVALDPDLTVIIKKLSKRDTITKHKALEELDDYLAAKEEGDAGLGAMVGTWTKLYTKLTIDVDRRVRIATNTVHLHLVHKVKKKLAPYLKEVIGAWVCSFFDPSTDVSKISMEAFQAAFPENKRTAPLVFCQSELLEYITDILLTKTPETLSDPRYTSIEDMAAKYARVVSQALQAVGYLIDQLPEEDRAKCQLDYERLFNEQALWSFTSNENALVRRAAYGLLRTLVTGWPNVVESRLDLISPTYLSKVFSDQDAMTQGELWDSLLILTKEFPQSWIIASAKKPMLPKLYHFLRSTASAVVAIAYPSIVVLLANLPDELTSKEKQFHKDVFTNFWKGLSGSTVDRSNSHVFLNAYAECLLYFVIRLGKSNDASAAETRAYLVNVEFWRLLETYLIQFQSAEVKDKLQPTSTCNILAVYLVKLGSLSQAQDLFTGLWSKLRDILSQTVADGLLLTSFDRPQEGLETFCRRTGDLLVAVAEAVRDKVDAESVQTKLDELVLALLPSALDSSLKHAELSGGLSLLASKLESAFSRVVFSDETTLEKLNDLFTNGEKIPSLLVSVPSSAIDLVTSCLVVFLSEHPDHSVAKSAFDTAVERVLTLAEPRRQLEVLKVLLAQLHAKKPAYSLANAILNEHIRTLAVEGLDSEGFKTEPELRHIAEDVIAISLLSTDAELISPTNLQLILTHFSTTLTYFNHSHHLNNSDNPAPSNTASATSATLTRTVVSILRILQKTLTNHVFLNGLVTSEAILIVADVFEFVFVKADDVVVDPIEEAEVRGSVKTLVSEAEECWKAVVRGVKADEALLDIVGKIVIGKVKESIVDVRHSASPADFVRQIAKLLSDLYSQPSVKRDKVISSVLFDEGYWYSLSEPFEYYDRDASVLAIIDPLVGLYDGSAAADASETTKEPHVIPHDLYGLTVYARLSFFVVDLIKFVGVTDFFAVAAKRDWILLQLLLCKALREDGFATHDVDGIWGANSHAAENAFAFRAMIQTVQDVLGEYLSLTTVGIQAVAQDWNAHIIQRLQAGTEAPTERQLDEFVGHAFQLSVGDKRGHHWARVFKTLISAVVRKLNVGVMDLEPWIQLVKTETTGYNLSTAVAILYALKSVLSESIKFKTLQNELASKLSGLTRTELFGSNNGQGWRYLTLLNASAPEMGVISIPQQRVTYLVRTVRKWYEEGDEHGSRLINAQVAKLLTNVAPVIQELSGSHWEFMLGKVLDWIEGSDPSKSEDLVLLYESLKLLADLRDLAESNDDIAGTLASQNARLFENILALLLKEIEFKDGKISKPRAEYEELLSQLAEFTPDSLLMNKRPVTELCELLNAPTEAIQKCAFALLKNIVKGTIQDLSVKLEFTATDDGQAEPKLDEPLFENISHPPDLNALDALESAHMNETVEHRVLGFLLSWMLLFDHFENSTFKLKEYYVAQLKEAELISVFLPFLFQILGLGASATPFDLSKWEIDQFDVQGFDSSSDVGFSLLSAHLYYRALKHLPSFVRIWWAECKLRQLSINVESYTEKYFSNLIIAQELASVLRPEVKAQLEDDDNMTVKTSRVTNEVTARYKIDEQTMEMAIRLPANFPLRQVDVEGLQRVGVTEPRWRGWLLATTAIIAVQNGDIVDALLLFKRNVKLHFEGVEDCTICYCIISIQDRTLPNKQCRTCKNRFHASCLYKWFKSSNQSSCPLCRTTF